MRSLARHKRLMKIAIEEAKKGLLCVSPNPAVGCVIAKENKIISTGFHQHFGGPHAEIVALKKAKKKAKGASLYVTLEPCSHFGKTPPCADAIINSGIKEVIAAIKDPNPVNNGRGLDKLKKNGIKVITGVLEKEAGNLNREFIRRMKKQRPFITLKLAQSLDGKIATKTGDSKWISSPASRQIAQRLRSKHDAIMIGVNTLIRDNPSLSIRGSSRQPVKIIVDSSLRTPANAKIFSKDSPGGVIIATTKKAPKSKEGLLKGKGADIIRVDYSIERVNLNSLISILSKRGIANILVEGGGELAASLFDNKLVDKIFLFIAPILIGGKDAVTSLEGKGIRKVEEALKLNSIKFKRVGKDFLIEADVYRNC